MYADPIVRETKSGKLEPVAMPLDLEAEYLDIVDNLKLTGKHFIIQKQAINFQTIS